MPITNGKNIIPIVASADTDPLPFTTPMTEIVVKNTTTPIISSIAASGSSVFVTEPFVLYSLTIEIAGAGAVASALMTKL